MAKSIFDNTVTDESRVSISVAAKWGRVLGITYLAGTCMFGLFVAIALITNIAAGKRLENRTDFEGLYIVSGLILIYLPAAILLIRFSKAIRNWSASNEDQYLQFGLRSLKKCLQWSSILTIVLVAGFFTLVGFIEISEAFGRSF